MHKKNKDINLKKIQLIIIFLVLFFKTTAQASDVNSIKNSEDSVWKIYITLNENTILESKLRIQVERSLKNISLKVKKKFIYDPLEIKSGMRVFISFEDKISPNEAAKISSFLEKDSNIFSATPDYPVHPF